MYNGNYSLSNYRDEKNKLISIKFDRIKMRTN